MPKRKFRKGRTSVLSILRTRNHFQIGRAEGVAVAKIFAEHYTMLGLRPGESGKVKVTIERIE